MINDEAHLIVRIIEHPKSGLTFEKLIKALIN